LATIINKQKFFKAIKYFLYCYIFIGVGLYFLQDFFLFHPTKLASNYAFNFNADFKEETIIDKENDTICLVKFSPTTAIKKGIVIYYHGNMENINHYASFVKPFTNKGYEVWMQDYPSFGKSTGKITEQKLYMQATQVAAIASKEMNSDSIILYGKSLGTGVAAYVASNVHAKKLILETPYYSIPSMFACYAFIYPTNMLSKYTIPTNVYLQKVKYPITIFHGTKDGVIPYSNAKKLQQYLKPADKFITIEGADHININNTKLYFQSLDSLLQ
jgi:uncharacterized protein